MAEMRATEVATLSIAMGTLSRSNRVVVTKGLTSWLLYSSAQMPVY